MNFQVSNGISVSSSNGDVFINGEQVVTPKGMKTNCSTVINGKIFIGGYEWKSKEKRFRKTFLAVWRLLF